MSKQDRQGARTVSDLEYKYRFEKRFAEIMGVATDAQKSAYKAQASVETLDSNIKSELSLRIKRDENDQIVSMLNASANIVKIRGNRISIVSDYFTLTEDGKITAKSGVFDNCEIKENCKIKGKLTGDTIASNAYKNLTGGIFFNGFTGTDSEFVGDTVRYAMQLSDNADDAYIEPVIWLQRDIRGSAGIYLAMSLEKERGAYVQVNANDVKISAVSSETSKIDLYGATNIYGNVNIRGTLGGTTIQAHESTMQDHEERITDLETAVDILTYAVRELGGNV